MPVQPASQAAVASPAWWDRGIFLVAEGEVGPDVIDITGRPRFLVFGPYVELESGVWRATVFLQLCPDAARGRLALQFGAEPDYTTVDLPSNTTGSMSVEAVHRMARPGFAQVRLWLKMAAFHGDVRFFGAVVERVAGGPDSAVS